MSGRTALTIVSIVLAALALTACAKSTSGDGNPVAGKQVFAENGCGGCHTFDAAGSKGTRGPNLDEASPSPDFVVSKLQRGGVLMPRYGDKLTPDQQRDVAAFVGAGNVSGKAVAKAFQPDGVVLTDCTGGDFECLEQAFGNLTFKSGPEPALAKLSEMSGSDQAVAANCHRIAHRMGSAALARFKDRVAPAFVAGSPVCASGYYHGIVERAFLGQPEDKLGVVAARLCSDPQINTTTFLSYQCIHGLGHGMMIYTGYDMPLALKTCDGLADSFRQTSCTGGVFMENFNSSYGVSSKYLRADDPIYPCNSVAERHKAQCYGLVTARLLKINGYDQQATAKGCERSEPNWVALCFESFGRDVSGIAQKDPKRALASCDLAGKYEEDCVYGVAREIVNSDANGTRGGEFCAQAPRATRERCHSGIGAVLVALIADPAQLEKTCREVSGRYAADCRIGAGLPI